MRSGGWSRPNRPARRRHRGQEGLTLIELLVAIAVMSIGVVGVAYGFSAAIRTGAVEQDQARLEVASRQLSDLVRSPDGLPYRLCASPSEYTASLPAPPAGIATWAITGIQVSHLTPPPARRTAAGTTVYPPPLQVCSDLTTGDWGVQEITIRVSTSTRSLTRVVWKGAT